METPPLPIISSTYLNVSHSVNSKRSQCPFLWWLFIHIYIHVCEEEIGTWCRLERLESAFVHRLLPCSQLEFHLFPHQNEMALIVGSDVWQEGGAGKQGKREGDAERNEEIDRWTGKKTDSVHSVDTYKR